MENITQYKAKCRQFSTHIARGVLYLQRSLYASGNTISALTIIMDIVI